MLTHGGSVPMPVSVDTELGRQRRVSRMDYVQSGTFRLKNVSKGPK
jgi:hypothetical protein